MRVRGESDDYNQATRGFRIGVKVNDLRPEFIDVANAAWWNWWLVPFLLIAPIMFAACVRWELNAAASSSVAVLAAILTGLAWASHKDSVMEAMQSAAVTPMEKLCAAWDTPQLMIWGMTRAFPLCIAYISLWATAIAVGNRAVPAIRRAIDRRRNPESPESTMNYAGYRESLVQELRQLRQRNS
jgi:hypothetical protein